MEIDYLACRTIEVSFACIIFDEDNLCSDFQIQYFWSKHRFFDRIDEFFISRSRGYIRLLISRQLFKFFTIDPIDIDIMGIKFDRICMSDLCIHSCPKKGDTLIAGDSSSQLVEDDSKITYILSMLSVEITDSEIEIFPCFGSESKSFIGIIFLVSCDRRKLKKISHKYYL